MDASNHTIQIPLTANKEGYVYIYADANHKDNDKKIYNTKIAGYEDILIKMPLETYIQIIKDFCKEKSKYHDSITSFAGAEWILYNNLKLTKEITYLYQFDEVDWDKYEEDSENNKIPQKKYRIFEFTKKSTFYVECEHG